MQQARSIKEVVKLKMRGIYILIIRLDKNLKIKVGKLGEIGFKKGLYAYVGSAQNNLEKRVARHKLKDKTKFWHIDYLLKNKSARILKVFYKKANKNEECKIAIKLTKTETSIPKFGCSDCNCESHLFKLKNLMTISKLKLKKY